MIRLRSYTVAPPGEYRFSQVEGIPHVFDRSPDIYVISASVLAFRQGNNLPRATLKEVVEDVDLFNCRRLGGMSKWCRETDQTFQEAPPSKLRSKPGCCGARVK